MKIVTAKEMQALDKETIGGHGVPGLHLMENAGRRVFDEIQRLSGGVRGKRATIIAGKGNNGGDGLVVARHLKRAGAAVSVYLLANEDEISPDARASLAAYKKIRGKFYPKSSFDLSGLQTRLAESDLVVDAIFGTGLSSPVKGLAAEAISAINASSKPVVSIDLPSGINADTGDVMGVAVTAKLTVTLALPKLGLFLYPGADHVGLLKIVDIGIPEALVDRLRVRIELLTANQMADLLPRRPANSHKGTFGHTAVIAGSVGKTGAAVMASLSALRAGAGMVTLAVPESLEARLPSRPWEIMTLPLPETADHTISLSAEKALLQFLEGKAAAAIGPGLSAQAETQELVRNLIRQNEIPTVLDADGLNAFGEKAALLSQARAPLILTPHPGEMARLSGLSTEKIQRDRPEAAGQFSQEHRVHVVLKGARTVVADPSGLLSINPTGNPGMATAGTGDVLTGIIAGLLSQGLSAAGAAKLGVYLHGLAGDLAAAQRGPMGLIAGDLIEQIPAAIRSLKEGC
jgi:ADP-dependent NAD(P)H-hydrate dehydratase / NAD(P)H-hydrate epimerase